MLKQIVRLVAFFAVFAVPAAAADLKPLAKAYDGNGTGCKISQGYIVNVTPDRVTVSRDGKVLATVRSGSIRTHALQNGYRPYEIPGNYGNYGAGTLYLYVGPQGQHGGHVFYVHSHSKSKPFYAAKGNQTCT